MSPRPKPTKAEAIRRKMARERAPIECESDIDRLARILLPRVEAMVDRHLQHMLSKAWPRRRGGCT